MYPGGELDRRDAIPAKGVKFKVRAFHICAWTVSLIRVRLGKCSTTEFPVGKRQVSESGREPWPDERQGYPYNFAWKPSECSTENSVGRKR